MYIVDIKLQRPSGEVVRVRKVSPVANLRGARAYERELREALLRGDREPPGVAAEVSTSSRFANPGDLADEEVSDNDNDDPAPAVLFGSGYPSALRTREREGDPPPHPRQQRAPQPPRPKIPTFAEFIPDFMRFQASPAASRRGANKPGELREKQRIFDNHLLPAFGALRLDQISARLVDTYVAVKAAPGGGASRTRAKATTTAANRRSNARSKALAPSTIANHLILLRRALSVAHRWELIERVPAIQSPIPAEQRFDFLTFEEAERFLAATRPEWRALFLLALRTGMRLGELRALRWRDVDLERGLLRVERNLTKAGYGSPKSGRARTVDLARDLVAALRAHPRGRGGEELVFCQGSGEPLSEGQMYRACQATAKAARLGRRVHPHMLRHTFASHCVMRGIPLAVVREWLGHAEDRKSVV